MQGGGERQHGVHLAAYLLQREAAGRELDRERGRVREVVVLPVGCRSAQPVMVVEAHAGGAGIDATGSGARPPRPDKVHVLVEPDRHPRPDAQDQVAPDPRLTLRERIRTGVVGIPGAAAAAPLQRPVGVQIDATAVLARATGEPVRVQVRDEPQIEARPTPLKRTNDRDAGTLVPMNAADHQHAYAL